MTSKIPGAPPLPDHCFVVGESRTNADNAITKQFGSFFMGFIIDRSSEQVLDFNCTHTLLVTETFLRNIFLGAHFPLWRSIWRPACCPCTAAPPARPSSPPTGMP